MAYEPLGASALDYAPCRYGASRLVFRGPARPLDQAACVILGSTEVYGRFVAQPFPALLEARLGRPVVNLGVVNAGPEVFAADPAVREIAAHAPILVVQAMGAHNLSNPYYAVHPRRNDRFILARPALRELYPEVDFTEFAFTRHLLMRLREVDAERFARVAEALRATWIARTAGLLALGPAARVLLWVAARRPEEEDDRIDPAGDPVLVTRAMLEAVRPAATVVVELVPSSTALRQGTRGMVFNPLESAVAEGLPGPAVHAEVAEALGPVLQGLLAR